MKTPGRDQFLPLLSAYVDGELSASERQAVEQHLKDDPVSARLVADLKAGSALMRATLEQVGDQADLTGFSDRVLAQLSPYQPSFLERLAQAFALHRGALVAGVVGAAVAVAVAIPLTLRLSTPEGYGAERVRVQTVAVEDAAQVKPVVMETDDGDAVIWVVDSPQEAPAPAPEPPQDEAAPADGKAPPAHPQAPPAGKKGEL